jgi:hypothetical protein
VLVLAGCGAGSAGGTTAAPTRDARCLDVPPSLVQAISAKVEGGPLTSAQAVKSFDYESATYFVSAKLASGDVGTWAVVGTLKSGGTTYAVDDVAKASSTWPAGDTSNAYISMIDDGADPSRGCVEAA